MKLWVSIYILLIGVALPLTFGCLFVEPFATNLCDAFELFNVNLVWISGIFATLLLFFLKRKISGNIVFFLKNIILFTLFLAIIYQWWYFIFEVMDFIIRINDLSIYQVIAVFFPNDPFAILFFILSFLSFFLIINYEDLSKRMILVSTVILTLFIVLFIYGTFIGTQYYDEFIRLHKQTSTEIKIVGVHKFKNVRNEVISQKN